MWPGWVFSLVSPVSRDFGGPGATQCMSSSGLARQDLVMLVDIHERHPKVGFNSDTKKSDLCYNMPDVRFFLAYLKRKSKSVGCWSDYLVSSDAQFL